MDKRKQEKFTKQIKICAPSSYLSGSDTPAYKVPEELNRRTVIDDKIGRFEGQL